MLSANASWLGSTVAKPRSAPGAMSCTISSIAVPSSPRPAWPGRTSTSAGRSPVACDTSSESTPSDITHTFTPAPVTEVSVRAVSAACAASPSETTEPCDPAARGDAQRGLQPGLYPLRARDLGLRLRPRRSCRACLPTARSTRRTSFQPAISFMARHRDRRADRSFAHRHVAHLGAERTQARVRSALVRMSTSVLPPATGTPVVSRGRAAVARVPPRRRSSTTSRLSSLRSAGASDDLISWSAAIWSAARALMPGRGGGVCGARERRSQRRSTRRSPSAPKPW